jgi:PAS domain S-box-containing protein
MGLIQLLQFHPLNGIALLISLAVIVWCLHIVRHVRPKSSRLMVGLVGMTAVIQGFRLLLGVSAIETGERVSAWNDASNLVAALVYLASLAAVKSMSMAQRKTEVALRLAEGNQALPLTLRQQQQQQLAAATAVHDVAKVVLDATPVPMFAVSLDGNVSCWNRAAERALGWSSAEVLGQRLPNLLMYSSEEHTNLPAGTLRLVRKDGAPLERPAHSVPIRDAKGAVNGILTVLSPLV